MSDPAGHAPLLSVVMPVFNEERTLAEILDRVEAVDLDLEIIMVDDGSSDASIEIGQSRCSDRVRLVRHESNQGKAGALATGFREARGDIVIIQDADLEYDPAEFPAVIEPILEDRADVVFGSRFQTGRRRVHYFMHYLANRILTFISNLCTNLNLTDMECCYKAFRREIVQSIEIESKRFAVEPELTQKVAKLGVRIWEVPVSYHGRDYDEGKKIGVRDALEAVVAILRFKFAWRAPTDFVLSPGRAGAADPRPSQIYFTWQSSPRLAPSKAGAVRRVRHAPYFGNRFHIAERNSCRSRDEHASNFRGEVYFARTKVDKA